MSYEAFLRAKAPAHPDTGISVDTVHHSLFEWQAAVVKWALRKGRACLFEDCGLGKTLQQLVWAQNVPGDVLILTPLAVAEQTAAEARRFGINAEVTRDGTKSQRGHITITNYERLHRYDVADFRGLVLDESSILKAHDGKTRTAIIEAAQSVPFRLACTATPAPNDHMELANHAEFVGAMTRNEMLARFFVHDGGSTQSWRLKGHARDDFWSWVATWAVMVRTPADLGYDATGYDLPALVTEECHIDTGIVPEGELFAVAASSMNDQRRARKQTMADRVRAVAGRVNGNDDQWVVWCELNAEGDALADAIAGAVQVSGSDSDDDKARKLAAFQSGDARVIVTKPKIAGFGLNWQHCHRMAFVGLSHSWEQFYQAVRRCWRFGQDREVEVCIVSTDVEAAVLQNIKRKQDSADEMAAEMVSRMGPTMRGQIEGAYVVEDMIETGDVAEGDGWRITHDDCVRVVKGMADESVHYSVFSPPFASLYTYTDDPRDMGNCANHDTFYEHFAHLVPELMRVTKPGRLLSFHCMDLPTSKARDGVIGLRDFRGELIRLFEQAGWILHSQVTIWKDPVTAMQRTKALGLLHKQLKKDSCMSRQGIPDYLVTMRKPGDNPERVSHTNETFPVQMWQRYASPVWMDIDPSDTLQFRSAREHDDERHICPLQLGVIRRALKLWTNEGDTVLSPFTGIGSEGHVALDMGRRFVGAELKRSYFDQARRNLAAATDQMSLAL